MKRIPKDDKKRLISKDKNQLIANLYANSTFLSRACYSFAYPLIGHLMSND